MATHYELLGVDPDAPLPVIRDAYRRAARAHHPDRHGDHASARMADVNRAWQVLKDPVRRREYDLTLAAPVSGPTAAPSAPASPRAAVPHEPARFPWGLMLVLLVLGVAFVVVSHLTATEPTEPAVDHILQPGDCVALLPNGDASERLCTEPHVGVVDRLVPFGSTCEAPAEPHRDEQGMGTVCVLIG